MSVYLFLSLLDPEERLRLDDDLLLLLFELERVRCTDDPELDRLLDDLTVLRDLLELLLLLVLLINVFPPSFTAEFKTAEPNRLKKLLPSERLELW